MTESFTIANATLVTGGALLRGSLRIEAGRIADIAEGTSVPPGALDAEGDLLAPGLIELHTDNLERHISPRPKVDWPHAAAIAAHDGELASTGITTVFDALRLGFLAGEEMRSYARPLASEIIALREAGALRISHFLHLRAEICSNSVVEELAAFHPEDRVGIVSLMDHTPGQRQFTDLDKVRDYVMGKRGVTEEEFRRAVAEQTALTAEHGARHLAEAVAAARRFGAALASHDDTTEAHVAESAGHGVAMAEFPTTLEAAHACRAAGIAVIMGAPNLVRGGSHSGNVAAREAAEAGVLDILSSDYVPSSLLLGAVMLGDLWGDMARGLATVTEAPARAAGLDDRGRLAPGLRADLLRIRRGPGGTPMVRGVWSGGVRVG
ncbi:alpha-D-ribose 1-methylphosphonate 5-triphosphate diphosphatase [Pseudoroseicyclus tamaricis]|uniref:Alpha-D-ribose 1-methylphosphonate 5-triphosphate diphosphatase n=1 Tax=Pseudoroseicyclus tamaricis TaxID=2705421 RepID=A0A6B2JIU2_9RHOB|nr:alpha-D-ribose 1-methylphosphonate 5-triphosphate diphosphatase [Pseudoroseicyclus tamaricis]NDV01323.1 alpha-D-ribose 1-methylphosphonate 5-triphosphate diphosphatase [Pseudoroseicyclus tamaricis]